ncbi:hypothetical protein VFPFJ_11231 [Purpureocillium lilacinum]|uniref:Uncharacterized protein n=1 Tax=Purpureocillium lilacinum TaxID=33203 RepID=A0A179FJD6_PURLI|nr:hypothetical protein VFPFJ_11231 [Purpureocillium lilacinum]OAQ65696.1 hypothetical protein VFPFJ_11231 [Purpureocillium lilacinum]
MKREDPPRRQNVKHAVHVGCCARWRAPCGLELPARCEPEHGIVAPRCLCSALPHPVHMCSLARATRSCAGRQPGGDKATSAGALSAHAPSAPILHQSPSFWQTHGKPDPQTIAAVSHEMARGATRRLGRESRRQRAPSSRPTTAVPLCMN